MQEIVAVILAAGKGTRMKSNLPKVLHEVGGKPMLRHVTTAAQAAGAIRLVVVVGFGGEQVATVMGGEGLEYVTQAQQLGTGHAVAQAMPMLGASASANSTLAA